jgi:hypothetical protein
LHKNFPFPALAFPCLLRCLSSASLALQLPCILHYNSPVSCTTTPLSLAQQPPFPALSFPCLLHCSSSAYLALQLPCLL